MAKKNFAERYETKIAEELQRKGFGKRNSGGTGEVHLRNGL